MTYKKEIEKLRKEIDRLNVEIVEKIVQRIEVAKGIGRVKRRHGQPVVNESREARVYEQVRELALRNDLEPDGVERVFKEIIRLCTQAEMEEGG